MSVRFVTTNEGKVEEAREYLPVDIERVDYDYEEVQADDLATIAERGAREAFAELGGEEPVVVDDTGLFVEALAGFPGPYAAYAEDTLGIEAIPELLTARSEDDRRARFRTVVAYADGEGVESFGGAVGGTIVSPRGADGFGYDPIFEYNGRTFAEMTTEEKNAISHRGRALETFAEWYLAERA